MSYSGFLESWRGSEPSICGAEALTFSSLHAILFGIEWSFKMASWCIPTLTFSLVPWSLKAYTYWLYKLESSVGSLEFHFFLPGTGRRKTLHVDPVPPLCLPPFQLWFSAGQSCLCWHLQVSEKGCHGSPWFSIAEGLYPTNTLCFPSLALTLSPAGSAHLSDRKGPLQRNQSLVRKISHFPLKPSSPPWHTDILGQVGMLQMWTLPCILTSTFCHAQSVTFFSPFLQVHFWLGDFLSVAVCSCVICQLQPWSIPRIHQPC